MKAKDLRIGNIVDYNTPCEINYNDIFEMAEFEKRAGLEDNMYSPIPLTDEWLLKFNFKAVDDDGRWESPNDGLFEVQAMYLEGDEYAHIWDTSFTEAPIKYVHQLQNLHFALTGLELTQAGGV